MAKLTALLLVVVLRAAATVSTAYATGATIPGLKARRSRFLLLTNGAAYSTPLPAYDCSKKTAAVCLAPGSPGAACCDGRCVDTGGSADHCGGCNKICKHDRVCCGGHCVDLMADKDNCGKCFNQCNKKCSYGFCDYAQ
ncbi:hypothetical protein HU200_052642 [Digitaria exilis]|uniref:Uncharacterized protein n=1 Tax=Digitaria exilis TaxID=1010633 RepID=A0A835AQK9_9POAL|nr:hypothetical protein HU200_052642 [Digitaria exilis]CAB3461875.1 unnamed protein product [Digitaria exilis]